MSGRAKAHVETNRGSTARFLHARTPHLLLAAFGLIWIATAIAPRSRQDWLLENLLVFVAVPTLVLSFPRWRFSNSSYVLIALFLAFHVFGAHYTYSEVPAGDWLRGTLGLERNHYDRVVHFLFGLLIVGPVRQLLAGPLRLRPVWAGVLAVHVILAWSAIYEIAEGLVARIVSPELGAAYTGTQGDIWDAQKDASLAFVGAILVLVAGWLRSAIAQPSDAAAPEGKDDGNAGKTDATS
jgi:putative membrane protein